MSRLRNLKGSPFWREKQSDLSDRWSTNNLVTKYRLKQYINQCGHFHSETPNFFTVLKHSENKKNSLAEEMKEKEWISKEKAPFGFLYGFSDDKVIRPFFFLAESLGQYSWSAKHYNSETCLATARIISEKGQHEF